MIGCLRTGCHMAHDTKHRILVRALAIVGDREQLARGLRVRPVQLDRWLSGSSEPPDEVFLRAVDIAVAAGMEREATRTTT